jgi:RNA polymerase sigma-70 factor (ECF subfamily)
MIWAVATENTNAYFLVMSIIKGIFTLKNSTESTDKIDLDELFKEFYDRLVYFSFQLIRDNDHAQDIVQDAFIKYWNQQEFVADNKIAIKNFLYTTVRNASLNSIRHIKVVEGFVKLQGNEEPEDAPVLDAIITAELMAELYAALQSLPENYRMVSVMGYLEGKKNQEIADELDMSINTVKKQKQRALQLLRLKLEPEMFVLLLALTLRHR